MTTQGERERQTERQRERQRERETEREERESEQAEALTHANTHIHTHTRAPSHTHTHTHTHTSSPLTVVGRQTHGTISHPGRVTTQYLSLSIVQSASVVEAALRVCLFACVCVMLFIRPV